jgi:hypothetical protein
MSNNKDNDTCEAYQVLMMGFIDNELDKEQEKAFRDHALKCPLCSKELVQYQKLADLTQSLKLKEPADYEWERIYKSIFYRLESRFGRFFVLTGSTIIFCYLLYEICVGWEMAAFLRIGAVVTVVGFILLLISAFRCRRRIKKYERYEAVKR